MTRRDLLGVACAALIAVIAAGCDGQGEPPKQPKVDAKGLLDALGAQDPFTRRTAATRLAKLAPEELQPVKSELEQAIKKEKDPGVKQTLKTALDKIK